MRKRIVFGIIIVSGILCLLGGCAKNQKDAHSVNTEEEKVKIVVNEFLNNLFSSNKEIYDRYKLDSNDQFSPIHKDINFLDESYAKEYIQLYSGQCTNNCLENMEYFSLFTYVDYLADITNSEVMVKDIEINETYEYQQKEETTQKKARRDYYYTVTLVMEPQGQYKEFNVQGKISLIKTQNQWKIADVMLSDYEALSIYITGRNVLESQ